LTRPTSAVPPADGLLDVYRLSTKINSSDNEGIKLLTPLQ
jgi:hypothetical protein